MSFTRDLLEQANRLARLDKGRPRQANLRRATSAAYYALFHFLTGKAVERLIPTSPAELKWRVSRSIQHREMLEVCLYFRRTPTASELTALIGGPVPNELKQLAQVFIDLQERRHSADYDTLAHFSKAVTLRKIADAEAAVAIWPSIQRTPEADVFLTALAFGLRWIK